MCFCDVIVALLFKPSGKFSMQGNLIQRKYKLVRVPTLKELRVEVNELLEREYKDTEGYLYVSSGRWQCLGAPFKEEEFWHQAMVFVRTEE